MFDYVLGQNAIVTTLSGGNPGLLKSSSHTVKLSGNLKPWSDKDITLSANYVQARVENPTVGFPTATAAIEAAFPGRFTRDAGGVLTRIDTRPINFAETSRSELRSGLNFSIPLKSKLQKQFEAFRAGKGPNPFASLAGSPLAARYLARGGEGRGGEGRGGDREGRRSSRDTTASATPPPAGSAPGETPGRNRLCDRSAHFERRGKRSRRGRRPEWVRRRQRRSQQLWRRRERPQRW